MYIEKRKHHSAINLEVADFHLNSLDNQTPPRNISVQADHVYSMEKFHASGSNCYKKIKTSEI